jgi:site-specific recombinase XerD
MRMLIHGKGEKDRYVMLSDRLVVDLREYWHAYHPGVWLFPGQDPSQPIGPKTVQRVFKRARDAAGIDKPATPHSLRHSFAVHLLEAGVNLKYIQELLGHSSIQSTLIYLKLAPECAKAVRSPLDQLPPLPPTRQR